MRFLLAVLLLLCFGAPGLAQEMETRVFVLNARSAESTVEIVRPMLSPQGKVFPESRLNKLVVRDIPQVLAEIESLLQQIDVHAPQVRITVEMHGVAQSSGGLVAVGVDGKRRGGVTGAVGGSSTKSNLQSQQHLVVMSGERGVLHFGRDLVTVSPYFQFANGLGLLPPGLVVQTVGTGFAVEPVVVGDTVRLRVTPWMSFQGAHGVSEVMVNDASTSVAVPSGQSVTISSGGYSEEIRNRSFGLVFGSGVRTGSQSASVTLTPRIMDY
ncbi:MAG: secretin N-terminal domain-containing protein [Vulcanimicrobiota bacterium]